MMYQKLWSFMLDEHIKNVDRFWAKELKMLMQWSWKLCFIDDEHISKINSQNKNFQTTKIESKAKNKQTMQ
jgi:hypothetical protein